MAKTSILRALLSLVMILACIAPTLGHKVKRPTIFILGDSTADVGTNNHLPLSQARADFRRNGVDFPHSTPTGRFSNGLNSADFLSRYFGLKKSPPPFLSLSTKSHFRKRFKKGVNFASGGAGLLDLTGANLSVVALSEQIAQFATVRSNLTARMGLRRTETKLANSLFFISVGSNDIFGYVKSDSSTPADQFIALLTTTYSNHIKTLYSLGARKFGIISVAPLGCCPAFRLVQMSINGTTDCFDPINELALAFNAALDGLLTGVSSQLPGMKYSLGNAYKMTMDVINNAAAFGFESVDAACCGHGALKAQGICNSKAALCPDRKKYLFWDMFHPTQKASSMAAETLYLGPTYYVSPINFYQLAKEN